MASIFTYQEEPPRVHSPWSTPGNASPRVGSVTPIQNAPEGSYVTSMTKLEPERQDGPTEYKLHLLLRARQKPSNAAALLNPALASPGKASSSDSLARSLGEAAVSTTSYHASQQSRQARLQQLTTQLLWRLQQSSPFHSSSNADLVLPVLPEATPRLGVPDRPARLLPGLEESQGALYEIGVADDGTLVGLVIEELEESLNNLRAMAASLGCVVDVLRRVLVAHYGVGVNEKSATNSDGQLWVAEVLVRPDGGRSLTPPLEERMTPNTTFSLADNKDYQPRRHLGPDSTVEQVRIAIVGASTAGKSSLLGTLTTSVLDNGRGKSRLSLLKHRHEITSGITSSVAQELIGYSRDNVQQPRVINYASGDISSWPDIHNLSNRLVFLSDSPGLPRYAKSAFRTLISWDPQWVLFCIPADAESSVWNVSVSATNASGNSRHMTGDDHLDADASIAHLDVCLKLGLRIIVVVTKMDIATKTGLKTTLSKVLSALKRAGRKPALLSAPSKAIDNPDENIDVAIQLSCTTSAERTQVRSVLDNIASDRNSQESHVPIVLTSSLNGTGFGKLHDLLNEIPVAAKASHPEPSVVISNTTRNALFHVDETFAIPPSRVYQAGQPNHSIDQGIVLCGHVASGSLAIGDCLRLGPFWLESDTINNDTHNSPRGTSYHPDTGRRPTLQPLPAEFSKSLQGERIPISGSAIEATFGYVDVVIVSLRSLRLPVRTMAAGDTGTVGIQPADASSPIPLSRARKGMVLSTARLEDLSAYRSFTADFPATDFAEPNTPPLILGGHAIVYINTIRAAVKVIAVHLSEADVSESSSPIEVFNFDGEPNEISEAATKNVRITFNFVSSIEWLQPGDRALIIPNTSAAGPISGPPAAAITGLSGFVGNVSEVFT